jgi:dephospho-CoA kinase
VAEFFRKWGALVISGDAIGHEVVEISLTVRKRLTAEFGKDIIVRGKVRRDRLAASAFASPEALLALNRIVHPRLIRELNSRVARARRSERHKAVVIDAALLAEWGVGRIHWDYLVGVWAPLEIRRARLRIRGLTDTQFHQRARQQMPWSQRRKLVDCVVKNDSTLSVLQGRARLCWTNLLS